MKCMEQESIRIAPSAALDRGARPRSSAKMAQMPVRKLLVDMGLPMMASMLGQALYNVVDTLFVSRIPDAAGVANAGELAINALTLAFPVQMLIMALGVGTGVGVNAVIARLLGMGEVRRAQQAAGNALFVSLLYCAAMVLFGLLGVGEFIRSQTANETVAAFGTTYAQIVSVFSLGTFGYMCLEKVTIAVGRTKITMASQIAGALTNIALDPILIYGWFGLPALGVEGAAIATVTGQFVSLVLIGWFYVGSNRILPIGPTDLKPSADLLKRLYRIGIPAIVMQILVPIVSYAMNLILGSVSESAVTAYGIYYKLQNFIFMPAYGLNNASIPIISFNYGAANRQRVLQAVRWALIYVTAIMAIGVVLLEGFARPIVSLFVVSADTEGLCAVALRLIAWGFFFAGVNIVLQGACQALGSGASSLVISLVRLAAVPLPVACALAQSAPLQAWVWLAIPLGEMAASAVAVAVTMLIYRRTAGGLD